MNKRIEDYLSSLENKSDIQIDNRSILASVVSITLSHIRSDINDTSIDIDSLSISELRNRDVSRLFSLLSPTTIYTTVVDGTLVIVLIFKPGIIVQTSFNHLNSRITSTLTKYFMSHFLKKSERPKMSLLNQLYQIDSPYALHIFLKARMEYFMDVKLSILTSIHIDDLRHLTFREKQDLIASCPEFSSYKNYQKYGTFYVLNNGSLQDFSFPLSVVQSQKELHTLHIL